MTIQLQTTLRNTMGDAVDAALGAGFSIEIRTGAQPANCAAADSGTLLATFTSVNFAAASSGANALSGTPYTATAAATGTAAHFRMKNGSTTIVQGTVATSGGDMTIDNTSITSGQTVTLSAYTLTQPGA